MRTAGPLPCLLAAVLLLLPVTLPAAADDSPRVTVTTSMGSFTAELWPEEAPRTVENFLDYVRRDFYDGLIFHRVIPFFMVQTGGYDAELEHREADGTIPNESVGGPRNLTGTLAMARQNDPDSAAAQWFVNVEDNAHLDPDGTRPGYTVFGRVVRGMDVVQRISRVETTTRAGMRDVPVEPVVIEDLTVAQ